MPHGTLEVHLVSASELESTDFLINMDAYCVITCGDQEKKSKSGSDEGEGSKPKWDETFLFEIKDNVTELKIKIMDKDTFSADDCVGEVRIPLEPVFEEERVEPTSYNVVKDEELCGGVRVGLKFTQQRRTETEYSGEEYGGYKQSSKEDDDDSAYKDSSNHEKYGGYKNSSKDDDYDGAYKDTSNHEKYGGYRGSSKEEDGDGAYNNSSKYEKHGGYRGSLKEDDDDGAYNDSSKYEKHGGYRGSSKEDDNDGAYNDSSKYDKYGGYRESSDREEFGGYRD